MDYTFTEFIPKKTTTFYSDFDLYEAIRTVSFHERRSISSQIVKMILEALVMRREGGLLPEELLKKQYIKDL